LTRTWLGGETRCAVSSATLIARYPSLLLLPPVLVMTTMMLRKV
jgi:hypothetical protein